MAFKFKDLIVDVLPSGETERYGCRGCSVITPCPTMISLTTTTPTTPICIEDVDALPALKEQLKKALALIEEHEKALQEGLALPKTREEAEDLERRLRSALAEVEEHKKTLE